MLTTLFLCVPVLNLKLMHLSVKINYASMSRDDAPFLTQKYTEGWI